MHFGQLRAGGVCVHAGMMQAQMQAYKAIIYGATTIYESTLRLPYISCIRLSQVYKYKLIKHAYLHEVNTAFNSFNFHISTPRLRII